MLHVQRGPEVHAISLRCVPSTNENGIRTYTTWDLEPTKLGYWDMGPLKLGYWDIGPLKLGYLGYWDPPLTPPYKGNGGAQASRGPTPKGAKSVAVPIK